ncbi:Voltage-dependent anion-selective channel [Trachymyrmex septentrionalis]|uniref:Voltage-dependent anion-selective channel n=1 Tax=Trachymyrmex septentrionalis TaxID=34720 RepID=A0A195F9K6_9HYME|nr:PREDICTED: voltage-dependent anion-selective channel-like [Trachymyrmex septentrionalis]KYN37061.1 Voltage-dependent anion-selective channel [Trachymyrmex septentrionalis]
MILANKLLDGLTADYSCIFSSQISSKTGKLITIYKHENVSATADFGLSLSVGPLIYALAVVDYQGWLSDYQTFFDSQRNKLTRNNFALGFTASDFILYSVVDNDREFNSSIYHKIKSDLEGAINLAYNK